MSEDIKKSGTAKRESKILMYYEIIDNLKGLIEKNPDDTFMNEKRQEAIDRFEERIQTLLHKKSIFRRLKDAIGLN